jgi:hypothetical protein
VTAPPDWLEDEWLLDSDGASVRMFRDRSELVAHPDGRFIVRVYSRSGASSFQFEAAGQKENLAAAKQTAIRVAYAFEQDEEKST